MADALTRDAILHRELFELGRILAQVPFREDVFFARTESLNGSVQGCPTLGQFFVVGEFDIVAS